MPGKVDCTKSNDEIKTKEPVSNILFQVSVEVPEIIKRKRPDQIQNQDLK